MRRGRPKTLPEEPQHDSSVVVPPRRVRPLRQADQISEAHATQRQRPLPLRGLGKMRHGGCGGRAGKVELLTGVEGVSSRPVRKILLRATERGIRDELFAARRQLRQWFQQGNRRQWNVRRPNELPNRAAL